MYFNKLYSPPIIESHLNKIMPPRGSRPIPPRPYTSAAWCNHGDIYKHCYPARIRNRRKSKGYELFFLFSQRIEVNKVSKTKACCLVSGPIYLTWNQQTSEMLLPTKNYLFQKQPQGQQINNATQIDLTKKGISPRRASWSHLIILPQTEFSIV